MMKLDFLFSGDSASLANPSLTCCGVTSETDRLTDVLLCRPSFLAPIPCCSVTEESLRVGFATSVPDALAQHRALERALTRNGVRCHLVPPDAGLPDMCFTRDALLTTPWGLLALNPATSHRRAETDHAVDTLHGLGVTAVNRIASGIAEGGDIAVVREGLVIVGSSGARTDEAGAESVASFFRTHGWEALIYRFDPHFLHLDTQFAMVDEGLALACTDVLSDDFLAALEARGIELIPVSYKEARALGCNVLALAGRRVLASADNVRVNALLGRRGYIVETVEIDQFTRCGGGVHCLTMPLVRVAA